METDATAPLSVFGQTKREGEQLIATTCAQHLIFRTSWVYAARGGNFAKTMLRLAWERNSLRVIDDQFGAPTGAELLTDVTAHAIRQVLQRPADAGLYHVAAAGEATWCSYENHVLGYDRLVVAATDNEADYFKAAHAAPIQTSAYPTPAQRPLNSRLNTGKLQATFGLVLPPWQAGVNRMLDETL